MSFPCVGDASASPCGCAPEGWEEYHSYVWDEFWNYSGRIVWMEMDFWAYPPYDKLITADTVQWVLENLFFEHIKEGAPLRMCFMNKAKRVAGVPWEWDYKLYVEYHESPAVPVAIALEGFFGLLALLGIIIVAYQLIRSGVIEKIGNSIITPAITGTALMFILGIGFIFVLANYMPGIRATAKPPRVPGAGIAPVTEVAVGPAATAARRRR